ALSGCPALEGGMTLASRQDRAQAVPVPREAEPGGLEAQREIAVERRELVDARLEQAGDVPRLRRAGDDDPRQEERRPPAVARVEREPVSLAQTLRRARPLEHVLGLPEREQDARPGLRRRGLRQRALQEPRGGLRRTAGERVCGSLGQRVDDVLVAGRVERE